MTTAASSNRVEDASQQRQAPHLAYLLSYYPAISHTFLLNEIVELRKLGFTIDAASINKPLWTAPPSKEETNALQETFYVKATKPARILFVLFRILLLHPRVLLRGLRAALRLDGWNLRASCYALFYLAEALLLGDWLRRRGHKHLHIHFGGPVATVGMLASNAWQLSYSLMLHGPDEFYDVERFYLKRKVEGADFVLCISDYCRSQVMKACDPKHWAKLHVVRLGVDLQVFQPVPQPDHRDALEIICVGRLVPGKGHLILLHAFADLRRRGHNLRLRLIGEGSERCALDSFVAAEALEDSVVFEGALNHQATRQRLAQADVFVLASFAEGVPIALMEAMAMEIPCVSTFVAGIPELIRDGVDGLLVPPSSARSLSEALERLICDADFRRIIAQAGRRRVQEFYDLKKNSRILADTLERCLAELPQ